MRRQFGSRAVLVFLVPPSVQDLRARLIKRRTEPLDTIRQRLKVARQELACIQWYDYVVPNRRLKQAIAQLAAIVIAERSRRNFARKKRTKQNF